MLATVVTIEPPHDEGKSIPHGSSGKEHDDDIQQAYHAPQSFHFNDTHVFLSLSTLFLSRDLCIYCEGYDARGC